MSPQNRLLEFWLEEAGPEAWYSVDEVLDERIRADWHDLWQQARDGGLTDWCRDASGALAYLVLTDQFPRNMFRSSADAFATDWRARAAARRAIADGLDLTIVEPERQFFYLPFVHSEDLSDQDRAVHLMTVGLPKRGADNLLHARAHREVIRRFGRFPFRNAALGRETTPDEQVFLDGGGYGAIVRAMRESHA
jgi:uncharacterized protein (DUF924 family)